VGDALSELGRIYDTQAPRIFRYIYHRLGNRPLAEDLTSEVFVRFIRSGTTPDNLTAFLYRIAHNLVVDYLRRNPNVLPLDDATVADRADPIDFAELEMEKAALRRAITRLTPEQQQVIVLKFIEGLSNDEIALVLGKSAGAVKAIQHRALETLRNLLGSTR
jgi:RNA polymerase sigma-70 factor (ECF subfamily)